jgi:hypothetical protein
MVSDGSVPIDFLLLRKHCPTDIRLAHQVPLPGSHKFKAITSRYVWLQCLQHVPDFWGPLKKSFHQETAQTLSCSSPRIQVPQIQIYDVQIGTLCSLKRVTLPLRRVFTYLAIWHEGQVAALATKHRLLLKRRSSSSKSLDQRSSSALGIKYQSVECLLTFKILPRLMLRKTKIRLFAFHVVTTPCMYTKEGSTGVFQKWIFCQSF